MSQVKSHPHQVVKSSDFSESEDENSTEADLAYIEVKVSNAYVEVRSAARLPEDEMVEKKAKKDPRMARNAKRGMFKFAVVTFAHVSLAAI